MGTIVGRNEYRIKCSDPRAKGCRQGTQTFSEQWVAQALALRNGWYHNRETGHWYCPSCSAYTAPVAAEPLRLSQEGWWRELGRTSLPNDLVIMLRGLIGATLHFAITPEATKPLIQLAKAYLQSGITVGDTLYTVMVWEPTDMEQSCGEERHRRVFVLVPAYPNSVLKRLEEFE